MKKVKLRTQNLEQTIEIAKKFASKLRGTEVIELLGDVGSGKTTFVGGMLQSLGSKDQVSSPTFTIENEYQARFTIYHLDFYRLDKAGILAFDLKDKIGKGLVIIEWSGIVKNLLPGKTITISFEVLPNDSRLISVKVPDSLDYALEGI